MDVSLILLKGSEFQKRPEGISFSTTVQKCLMKVDEEGLFVVWQFHQRQEVQSLELSHIKEVRTGVALKDPKSLLDQNEVDKNLANRVLSFYYGFEFGSLSVMQFIAPSEAIAEQWVSAISPILCCPQLKHLCIADIMKKQWKRLMYSTNARGMIPIRKLVKQFGHDKNEKAVISKLNAGGFTCAKNEEINPKDLTFEVYKKIYQRICERPDLQNIFTEITKADHIKLSEFVTWLNEHQRDPRLNEILVPTYDEKRASAIIQKFEPDKNNVELNRLSLQGFTEYLNSQDNPLIYPEHLDLYQDMDQPLSRYFINSSHNTYLVGRQIGGKSSVDIYRHILLSGCRCVELDCWDGKGNFHGEPIVTHGNAVCTVVPFKNILYAIKETAFVTSQFPVILSFETHCSKPLQLKMAKYCEEVFGEMLLSKCLDTHPLERGVPLPPPSALKRKILIKNKRLDSEVEKAQLEEMQGGCTCEDTIQEEEEPIVTEEEHPGIRLSKSFDTDDLKCREIPPKAPVAVTKSLNPEALWSKNSSNSVKKVLSEEDEREVLRNYEYVKPSATNIHPRLSTIVNYCQSVKFAGFKKLLEAGTQRFCFQMSSFSESVGLSHVKSNAIELVTFNQCQLSRIYPKGNRVDSSNYMPQIFWNVGSQMVSLNFQTCDLGQQLNAAKFEYNASSGYLLKPEMLSKENRFFDPFAESTVDGVIAAQCAVKVISAQFISDRPTTSHVEVDMYGLPNDTIRKEYRTNQVTNNSLNPQFNQEFLFRKVIFPDLALLRFTLYDDGRQLLGQRVIPLSSLQNGFRYVSLRTSSGVPLDSTSIFVKISLRSYVPDSLMVIANALENPKAHQMSLSKQHEEQLRRLGDDVADSDTEDDSSSGGQITRSVEDNDSRSSARVKAEKSVRHDRATNNTNNDKNVITEVADTPQLTVESLLAHPTYVRAFERKQREASKMWKKQSKSRSKSLRKQKSASSIDQGCFPFGPKTIRRRAKSDKLDSVSDSSECCNGTDLMTTEDKKATLCKALESIHEQEADELKQSQEKEMSDLEQRQTKQWMEKSKVVKRDKSIPSAEKERILKDHKSQEVKKFMEERQRLKTLQLKGLEKLKSLQNERAQKLKVEIDETDLLFK